MLRCSLYSVVTAQLFIDIKCLEQPTKQSRQIYTRTKQLWKCGPGDVGTLPDCPTLEVSDWGTVDELSASSTQKGTHGLGLETSKFTLATHLDVAKGLSVYLLTYPFLWFPHTLDAFMAFMKAFFFLCRHSAWESALESRIKAPFRKIAAVDVLIFPDGTFLAVWSVEW